MVFTKGKTFNLFDKKIHPGERANLAVELPEMFSFSPMYMPIKVINGKEKGPVVTIFAGLKGDEFNGMNIVHKLSEIIDPSEIKGTIILIPFINIYALATNQNYLKSEINLVNCFPGKKNGSFGERIAYVINNSILKKCDIAIEIKSGGENVNSLPQLYCKISSDKNKEVTEFFDCPVISDVKKNNALRKTLSEVNVESYVIVAGESNRVENNIVSIVSNGIKNFLHKIGVDCSKGDNHRIPAFISNTESWKISPYSGVLNSVVNLGDKVDKGQVLGVIEDYFGGAEPRELHSIMSGVVVGINNSPMIHEGQKVYKVATFSNDHRASDLLENWDENFTQED